MHEAYSMHIYGHLQRAYTFIPRGEGDNALPFAQGVRPAVLLFCCPVVLLSRCHVVLLSCCPAVLLSCRSVVLLSCCALLTLRPVHSRRTAPAAPCGSCSPAWAASGRAWRAT